MEGLFSLWFEGLESIMVARHGGSWSHCAALRCREIVAGAELAFFCIFYSVKDLIPRNDATHIQDGFSSSVKPGPLTDTPPRCLLGDFKSMPRQQPRVTIKLSKLPAKTLFSCSSAKTPAEPIAEQSPRREPQLTAW